MLGKWLEQCLEQNNYYMSALNKTTKRKRLPKIAGKWEKVPRKYYTGEESTSAE